MKNLGDASGSMEFTDPERDAAIRKARPVLVQAARTVQTLTSAAATYDFNKTPSLDPPARPSTKPIVEAAPEPFEEPPPPAYAADEVAAMTAAPAGGTAPPANKIVAWLQANPIAAIAIGGVASFAIKEALEAVFKPARAEYKNPSEPPPSGRREKLRAREIFDTADQYAWSWGQAVMFLGEDDRKTEQHRARTEQIARAAEQELGATLAKEVRGVIKRAYVRGRRDAIAMVAKSRRN